MRDASLGAFEPAPRLLAADYRERAVTLQCAAPRRDWTADAAICAIAFEFLKLAVSPRT
jgi:hypothetical protein